MRSGGKWLVLLGSVLCAVLLGRWLLSRAESSGPLVEFIDNTAELDEFLKKSQGSGKELPPMSPDEFIEREPWSEALVGRFYPMIRKEATFTYDEELGFRRIKNRSVKRTLDEHPKGGYLIQSNSLGLRDREIIDEFDVRIFFSGDSQTESVCGVEESFVNLLEGALSLRHPQHVVDVINGGLGGTHPWHYLDTIKARADLSPDIHVSIFFGGNDLAGVITLERYYRGRGPGRSRARAAREYKDALKAVPAGLGPVDLQQCLYFLSNPLDAEYAVAAWSAIAMEMARECERQGALFVPVYLPSPLSGQPDVYAAERQLIEELMPDIFELMEHQHVLADRWIEDLRQRDVEVFDLRPKLLASRERLFWSKDFHLNLEGQVLVAEALEEALAPKVAALLSGSLPETAAEGDSDSPK